MELPYENKPDYKNTAIAIRYTLQNRQNPDVLFTKEIEENGKMPFLDCLVTQDYLQKTDTYRPITRPVIVQPDLSQGYNYTDFDETSATRLRLTWQPMQDETDYLNNVFSKNKNALKIGFSLACLKTR